VPVRWETWTLFLLTETILCLTPGPAVLFVLSQGLGGGAAASLRASFGILAGNALYFLLSATGLGAILVASYDLFFFVKWAGAAYLIWLGLRALRASGTVLAVKPATRETGSRRVFARAFAVQASNPKAIVFFTALLPQFIDPGGSVPLQVAILAVTSIVVEFVVLASYGVFAGRVSRLATRPRIAAFLERAAGALLIGAGLRMAALRRAG
jgi:homoserine/homoserine lactone efflux protein